MSEALYNYSDPFPSQPGMDRLTPRGQIIESVEAPPGSGRALDPERLAEWSASGRFRSLPAEGRALAAKVPTSAALRPTETAEFTRGARRRGSRPVLSTRLESAASRARVFRNLISSPKIGGVLIGREPGARRRAGPSS